jgi:hypothetical protein
MKQITLACLAIVLIGTITSTSVWARDGGGWHGGGHYGGGWGYGHGGHYGHFSFGFYFNAPFYPYSYYPYFPYQYPYYYPLAVITVPATPPVYIQQSPPTTQQYPAGYWYYCNNSEGYFPYIKECPDGWQQVKPIPPAPR